MTETITLKAYLLAKGYQLKAVSRMIGMEYPAFWQFLRKDSSLQEESAKALEFMTQGDWVAYEVGNRYKMKIRMEA